MGEILRAENISKTYQAGRVVVKALNRCSFTVERGEFVAVVGRSGSGKSTLLRILASFDKPDEGKVYVEGEDISGLKGKSWHSSGRKKIGFIYQTTVFSGIYSLSQPPNSVVKLYLPSEKAPAPPKPRMISQGTQRRQ